MDALLIRLLRMQGWTCNPKPAGAPPSHESWDSPDGKRLFWVIKADACDNHWKQIERKQALRSAARKALGWTIEDVDAVEFGERLGLLRSADMALDRVDDLARYDGTSAAVSTDARARRDLLAHAEDLVKAAGLTLEAWLATREQAPAAPVKGGA